MKKTKSITTAVNLNKKRSKSNNQLVAWLFLLPFIIGFVLYFSKIFVDSLSFAFSEIKLGEAGAIKTFVGFENFKFAVAVDPKFNQLLLNAVKSLLLNIPIIMIFSLFVAVVLNGKIPGRTFFRAVFFIPVIISTGLIEMIDIGNLVLGSMGTLEGIQTGEQIAGGALNAVDVQMLLQSMDFSPAIIGFVTNAVNNIVSTINMSGVQILIFLAGLQSISPSIYESAKIEGATSWEIFWKITLPMISPMILVNLFYTVIDFLTRNSNELMIYIKSVSFEGNTNFGGGAAMSWIYFLAMALVLVIFFLIINRFVFYQKRDK